MRTNTLKILLIWCIIGFIFIFKDPKLIIYWLLGYISFILVDEIFLVNNKKNKELNYS